MGLKNALGTGVLRWLGRKADGHKTTGTGVAAILMGIAGFLLIAFNAAVPEAQLPELDFETCMALVLGGFGALGIGGKLEKTKKALEKKDSEGPTASPNG